MDKLSTPFIYIYLNIIINQLQTNNILLCINLLKYHPSMNVSLNYLKLIFLQFSQVQVIDFYHA
jgi:hypothetical protein